MPYIPDETDILTRIDLAIARELRKIQGKPPSKRSPYNDQQRRSGAIQALKKIRAGLWKNKVKQVKTKMQPRG